MEANFEACVRRYLEIKQLELKPGSYRAIRSHFHRAIDQWADLPVDAIRYAQIEDFLHNTPLTSKSKANIRGSLHAFFVWAEKREIIDCAPKMPEIRYQLGWRTLIDKATQRRVLDEIKHITKKNPRVHLAVSWLSTYLALRPGDIRKLLERDVDRRGFLIVKDPKDRSPKVIPLISEDTKIVNELPRSDPEMFFFRHKSGRPFGVNLMYKVWKKACDGVGVEGVDLYGGTRHSSAKALLEKYSPDQIKRYGTLHTTNRAFDRYLGPSEIPKMLEMAIISRGEE
jgi:hypothetical protein